MALANARYNVHNSWFADVRAFSIQEVARQALTNPQELGQTLPALEQKLRATPFYGPLFETAFGTPEITSDRVLRALEQYVQALISYRTKYDAACDTVGGVFQDCAAGLTAQEMRGLQLFTRPGGDEISCTNCHDLPSGANVWLANNGIDVQFTDPGDGRGVFRPATLRNVALTAPYMHDGRFATLREVIDHYDHGIRESAVPRHAAAKARWQRQAHGPAGRGQGGARSLPAHASPTRRCWRTRSSRIPSTRAEHVCQTFVTSC